MDVHSGEHEGAGVIEEVRAVLSRHLPSYEVHSIAGPGGGWDNVVYEVNGELIVRQRLAADPNRRSELTRREAELLAVVGQWSTLPVPEPIFADFEAGVLAYVKLPGVPLIEQPPVEMAHLAATLGGFVSGLQRAPLEVMERLVPRDVEPMLQWREDAERDYRAIVEWVPVGSRPLVEDFLSRRPPAEPRAVAFCHNDLGSEHVLVDPEANTVTGIIDWSDAAVADPMYDLGRLYRDLGPATFELVLAHYEGAWDEADRERAVFYARCALLEDIAYGVRSGARRYVEVGLAHLGWTFA